MSRFDEDTSTMRMRIAATPIELRKPESGPQPRARGILVGVLLGAAMWAAIIALGVAIWTWLS
jgi:fatty acid desaturase